MIAVSTFTNGELWMKKQNELGRYTDWQSEFSHRYACWAANHNGWAKMKKFNKKVAKKRLKRDVNKHIREQLEELDNA